jgi:hypothetical protein
MISSMADILDGEATRGPIAAAQQAGFGPMTPIRDADTVRFEDVLRGRTRAVADDPEQARKIAEEFVAIAFVEPILAETRKPVLVDEEDLGPFAPGRAEKAFRPQLDARFARSIVSGSNFPLVDRVAADLLARAGVPTSEAGHVRRSQVDVHG